MSRNEKDLEAKEDASRAVCFLKDISVKKCLWVDQLTVLACSGNLEQYPENIGDACWLTASTQRESWHVRKKTATTRAAEPNLGQKLLPEPPLPSQELWALTNGETHTHTAIQSHRSSRKWKFQRNGLFLNSILGKVDRPIFCGCCPLLLAGT